MNPVARLRRSMLIGLGVVLFQGVQAQPASEHAMPATHSATGLLFFLSAEGHHFSGPDPSNNSLNEDAWASSDIVFTVSHDRFRLFGEYLVSSREHDLERLQLGYEPVADTVVWVGRFHQPASAWNTEHHHGRYLQTAITRPSVELWEDEGGILPQHLTGVLVDSRLPLGENSGLLFSLGGGLGSLIEQDGLAPFDVLSPYSKGRRASWTGRLAYLPEMLGSTTQFGLLAGRHHLPVVDTGVANTLNANLVQQEIIGAFATLHEDPWRVAATVYDVHVDLQGAGVSSKESFTAGYVQVERLLPRGFTVYGRGESSSRAGSSRYIAANHQGFELRRATAGLKWDFRTRQALTAELARGTTLEARRYEFRVQWSAAFP